MQDSWLGGIAEGTEYPYDFITDILRGAWARKRSQGGRNTGVVYQKELDANYYHCSFDKAPPGSVQKCEE